MSDMRHDFVHTFNCPLSSLNLDDLTTSMKEMTLKGHHMLCQSVFILKTRSFRTRYVIHGSNPYAGHSTPLGATQS